MNNFMKAGAGPLERLTQQPALVEQVVEQLRDRILSRAYPAGEELPPEGTLAERFGVSRTVVREAMRSLRAQGFVDVSQGRRPRVKPADPQAAIDSLGALFQRSDGSALDLMEVRRPVEGEIAFLAAERATPEHVRRLAEAMADEVAATTLEERVAADMRFHEILAEATGNPVFRLLLTTLWGLLHTSLTRTIKKTGARRAVDGHQLVLDAVERRDANAAREAMLLHLREAEHDLRG